MKSNAIRSALTLVVLGVVAAVTFSPEIYKEGLISAYFSVAVACGAILLLNLRPHLADAVLVVCGAVLLALADYFIFGFDRHLMSAFSFLGLSAIAVLGVRSIWAEGREQKILLCGLIPLVVFIFSEWSATSLLDLTERLHPRTLDPFLYKFDGSLGVQLSFLLGKRFVQWSWLRTISLIFYIGLPIPLTLVYVRHLIRRGPRALPIIITFVIVGPVGVIFFNLFPAAGPIHLCGPRFPFGPLGSEQLRYLLPQPTPMHALRNAIPSLHLTWVLLAWWNSRGLSWRTRGAALVFLFFTVLATLGSGEHYLIDLIVAVPFALMLQSVKSIPSRRRDALTCFVFGLSTVLLWMIMLRFAPNFFWISRVIPWTLVIATVATSIWLERRLATQPMASTEVHTAQEERELVATV
jgi:hypothetical protein